jgi:hypothetical protein
MTLKSHILFEELLVLAFVKFIVDFFFGSVVGGFFHLFCGCILLLGWWMERFRLLYSVALVVDGKVSSVSCT